jgi:tetratricopeptide (TPR) repeat protein
MVLSIRYFMGLSGKIGALFFITAVLSLSLFAQSAKNAPDPIEEELKKTAEARKIRCASSPKPLCEDIEVLSDFINQRLKLVAPRGRIDLGLLYLDRGRLYFESRLYKRALIDFNRADAEFDFKLAITDRAYIYVIRGEFTAAVNEYDRVLKREPGNPYALGGAEAMRTSTNANMILP